MFYKVKSLGHSIAIKWLSCVVGSDSLIATHLLEPLWRSAALPWLR